MNRLDNWIESRLMNAKKNKSAVSTKDLIAEIIGIFNLKTSRQSIRNLKEKIKTIRNRVNKKCARRKQTCERCARQLFVPPEMIQRWVENGLFRILLSKRGNRGLCASGAFKSPWGRHRNIKPIQK